MDAASGFITEPNAAFMQMVAGSADMTQINQDQRPLRDGQVLFKGTYEVLSVPTAGGTSSIEARPPKDYLMAEKQDKSGKYYAGLPFLFRLDSIGPQIDGHCEVRTDGKPGWRLMAAVKHFAPGKEYLLKNREVAWRDPANTPEWQSVRDYITADGTIITQKWLVSSPGDQIKMKLRDGKDNLFRKTNPDQPGVLMVQPSTPLILPNVQAVVWVNCKEETEVVAPPEGSPPETKPTTRTVKRLVAYNTYECKGNASVDPAYDKNMCLSERKHADRNAHVHHLVPIEEFQSGKRLPSRSAYFYVSAYYNTAWREDGDPNMPGIVMVREQAAQGDYVSSFNNERSANLTIRFNLFQWHGQPHRNERYIVKLVCAAKDRERLCGSYGILDLNAWEAIQLANPEIPVHVEAQLWDGFTLNHPSNAPDVIRADEKVATVRGYYVYGITEAVPDLLRYFTGPRGLKLSREWVLREFSTWHTKNAAGRESVLLTPPENAVDKVRRNPLNVFSGDKGVVVALGNGQVSNPTEPYSPALYLAYAGEAMTLFTGAHDFYILVSHHMNGEEAACWAGPNPKSGPYADAFIDTLRTAAGLAKKEFFYWIYAVRKDAKRAPPKPAPVAYVKPTSPKREREEVAAPEPTQTKLPALAVSEAEPQQEEQEEEDEDEMYQKAE